MHNILITGGCGFIGSNLAKEYVKRDCPVVILDNLVTGKIDNIGSIIANPLCKFVCKDISQVNLVELFEKHHINIVHHFAARPRVKYSVDYPLDTNEQNITNTLRILEAARHTNIKRVIYSASSSAYGNTDVFPTHEKVATNPRSPYALQKFVGEEYCRLFSELYQLDTVSLRYFNVFGINSFADSQYSAVIPIFIEQIYNNQPLTIDGAGEQSRDFTYVDNVVEANILAASCADKLNGTVINCACGNNISINHLADRLMQILNKKVEKTYRESRAGDVLKTHADISKARSLLNYSPIVNFDAGLRLTVEWYLSYLKNR